MLKTYFHRSTCRLGLLCRVKVLLQIVKRYGVCYITSYDVFLCVAGAVRVCATIRLCLGYNINNYNNRSVQHSKEQLVVKYQATAVLYTGPNSNKQLSEKQGSPGQLKEKKNYTTHTRQYERQQHTTVAAGAERFAVYPGVSFVVGAASRRPRTALRHHVQRRRRRGTADGDRCVLAATTAAAPSSPTTAS